MATTQSAAAFSVYITGSAEESRCTFFLNALIFFQNPPKKPPEAGKKRLNELDLAPAEYELAIKRLAETLGI